MKKAGLSIPMIAAVAALGACAVAQVRHPTPRPSKLHAMVSVLHRKPVAHPVVRHPLVRYPLIHKGHVGGTNPFAGQVIGNRSTHVYHLPGDRGTLPAPGNRVYFKNETAARFAGYHKAQLGGVKSHAGKMAHH